MDSVATITLKDVNDDNWLLALKLAVHPDQRRFVSEIFPVAAIALAKAYVRPDGMIWLPYMIYADEEPVGFVQLVYPPETYKFCWMFHFFIDESQQGKGYGKIALNSILQMVKQDYPTCKKIQLTVHPDNDVAQRMYTRAGFQPIGKNRENEPIYELIL